MKNYIKLLVKTLFSYNKKDDDDEQKIEKPTTSKQCITYKRANKHIDVYIFS